MAKKQDRIEEVAKILFKRDCPDGDWAFAIPLQKEKYWLKDARQICQLFEKSEPPDELLLTELREKIAEEIGEWRWKDSFYGEFITENDRNSCRVEAGLVLSLATPILLAEGAKKEREKIFKEIEKHIGYDAFGNITLILNLVKYQVLKGEKP